MSGSVVHLDTPDDPRLDDYRDIRDRDLRGPDGRPGLFIGEQALTVEKMLAIDGLTKSVLIAPHWETRIAPLAPPEVPVYVAPPPILESVAGFDIHRGVLAVGHRPPASTRTLDAAVPRDPGPLTVLVCEDITNIDNIGHLFRNAAAFGVDAVVLSPKSHDPLYRKSIRVSVGHVLTRPWARSEDWASDLRRLRDEWGLTLIAAATGEGALALDDIVRPERVGLVVGQEFTGICRNTLDCCSALARIPMAPGVDSLNVAVASAVCLHRFSRAQRE